MPQPQGTPGVIIIIIIIIIIITIIRYFIAIILIMIVIMIVIMIMIMARILLLPAVHSPPCTIHVHAESCTHGHYIYSKRGGLIRDSSL